VSELECNVPFQHKHGYIRDEVFDGTDTDTDTVTVISETP